MERRLFLIINPSQYLNAVELVNKAPAEEDHLVIVSPFMPAINDLDQLGANQFWTTKRTLDTSVYQQKKKKYWHDRWRFISSAFTDVKPDTLVTGNLGDSLLYAFLLTKKRKVNSLIALDDGTPSLDVATNRRAGSVQFYRKFNLRSASLIAKQAIYLNTLALLYPPPASIKFFSLFDVAFGARDDVIKNDYAWLRSKVQPHKNSNEAVFIGSHLVRRKLVSQANYLKSIEQVNRQFTERGVKMRYCHHRGELESTRRKVAELVETVDFGKPLELAFLDTAPPKIICGHFSTAVLTIPRIYPTVTVEAYLFPDHLLTGNEFESKKYLQNLQDMIERDSRIESYRLQLDRSSKSRPD